MSTSSKSPAVDTIVRSDLSSLTAKVCTLRVVRLALNQISSLLRQSRPNTIFQPSLKVVFLPDRSTTMIDPAVLARSGRSANAIQVPSGENRGLQIQP